ncbi:MAG: alkaline phosphatase family protein [Chitinophagaceae bacterium]
MKALLISFLIAGLLSATYGQSKIENVIIVTTDGYRWQELFGGMDPVIANDKAFHQGDSLWIQENYGGKDAIERRKKLMPFIWTTIASKGQIYGNRTKGNFVNNANPYWFSYPGYNEIFTGFPDTAVNSNDYPPNPHVTLLEYLHKMDKFKGKVAAFGAWEAFDRILNEKRAGFQVVSAFDTTAGSLNPNQKLINSMLLQSFKPFHNDECLDVFTHYAAMEYLKINKPKVLYISYGETDEWAHAGRYRYYLDAAHQVDAWLSDLWNYIQSQPEYKDKTALFITTDHGRGDIKKKEWTDHGSAIADASEIWFALIAPGIQPIGEAQDKSQLYQKQFAQTIAHLLGLHYQPSHPVGEAINIK